MDIGYYTGLFNYFRNEHRLNLILDSVQIYGVSALPDDILNEDNTLPRTCRVTLKNGNYIQGYMAIYEIPKRFYNVIVREYIPEVLQSKNQYSFSEVSGYYVSPELVYCYVLEADAKNASSFTKQLMNVHSSIESILRLDYRYDLGNLFLLLMKGDHVYRSLKGEEDQSECNVTLRDELNNRYDCYIAKYIVDFAKPNCGLDNRNEDTGDDLNCYESIVVETREERCINKVTIISIVKKGEQMSRTKESAFFDEAKIKGLNVHPDYDVMARS